MSGQPGNGVPVPISRLPEGNHQLTSAGDEEWVLEPPITVEACTRVVVSGRPRAGDEKGASSKYKALADALSIDKGCVSLSLATPRQGARRHRSILYQSILCQRERDQARAQHR